MIDKRAARIWVERIREILNRDWDPIGGCPEDEYDRYAGKLATMIRSGASDTDLLNYLEWAEVEYMGLGPPFDRDRGVRVVKALRELWSSSAVSVRNAPGAV